MDILQFSYKDKEGRKLLVLSETSETRAGIDLSILSEEERVELLAYLESFYAGLKKFNNAYRKFYVNLMEDVQLFNPEQLD